MAHRRKTGVAPGTHSLEVTKGRVESRVRLVLPAGIAFGVVDLASSILGTLFRLLCALGRTGVGVTGSSMVWTRTDGPVLPFPSLKRE